MKKVQFLIKSRKHKKIEGSSAASKKPESQMAKKIWVKCSPHFEKIQAILEEKGKVFIFLGRGVHKIKKKAEQMACKLAIEQIKTI